MKVSLCAWAKGIVAIAITMLLLYLAICAFIQFRNCGLGIQWMDLSDIAKQKSVDQYFAYAKFYASLAMALIGAYWALLFAKGHRYGIRKWPELLLSIDVFLGFCATMFCHFNHSETIITRGFEVGAIELGAPIVQFWFHWQRGFFYYQLGVFLILAIILFLKRNGTSPTERE